MSYLVLQPYRRGFKLISAFPLLILLPVIAEGAQHISEISLGMYSGGMNQDGKMVRLAFGAVKVLSIFITLLVAWRWWRSGGDADRSVRPSMGMLKGIGLVLLLQLGGEAVALALGRGLALLLPDAATPIRFVVAILPVLGWLFVSGALFPWYVGVAVEDRSMSLRASIDASRGRLLSVWGLLIAGTLPLMGVHYALGYAAILGIAPIWPLLIVDTAVVGGLAAMIAATYFTIYERASARIGDAAHRRLR